MGLPYCKHKILCSLVVDLIITWPIAPTLHHVGTIFGAIPHYEPMYLTHGQPQLACSILDFNKPSSKACTTLSQSNSSILIVIVPG